MHSTLNRKVVVSAVLSIVFALSLSPVAFAAPLQPSIFNAFDLLNRDADAADAVLEAGQKRVETVGNGIAFNMAQSISSAVEDTQDTQVETSEYDSLLAWDSDLSDVPESVLRARSCLGVPYESGAAGPSGFDCSGLVSYALTGEYRHVYTSYAFWGMDEVDDPRPGDVVACHSGHCGLYIGEGLMIHAPQSGEVVRVEPIRGKVVRPTA